VRIEGICPCKRTQQRGRESCTMAKPNVTYLKKEGKPCKYLRQNESRGLGRDALLPRQARSRLRGEEKGSLRGLGRGILARKKGARREPRERSFRERTKPVQGNTKERVDKVYLVVSFTCTKEPRRKSSQKQREPLKFRNTKRRGLLERNCGRLSR